MSLPDCELTPVQRANRAWAERIRSEQRAASGLDQGGSHLSRPAQPHSSEELKAFSALADTFGSLKTVVNPGQESATIYPTPPTNRGVENKLDIMVHHITGTTDEAEDYVLDVVSDLLDGADYQRIDKPLNMYGTRFITLAGIMVLCNPFDSETMPAVCVVIPGSGCELLGLQKIRSLHGLLNLTRLDLAFDGGEFSPAMVRDMFLAGEVKTRVRRGSWDWRENAEGRTVYLGSRQSTAYMRVYDRRGFNRIELELKEGRADTTFELLFSTEHSESEFVQSFSRTSVGVLRGFIDFIVPHSSNNALAALNPLWEKLTQGFERLVIKLAPRPAATIQKVHDWIEGQVSAMLVTYQMTGKSLNALYKLGKSKMTDRHRSLVLQSGRDIKPKRSQARLDGALHLPSGFALPF